MEMDIQYYKHIFDDFVDRFPMWADDIVSYTPKHMHAIRVYLRDGSQVDYNFRSRSCRFVNRRLVENPNDISDDEYKTIFAANLAEFMAVEAVGQAALAERTGLSSAIISKYLSRQSMPNAANLQRIAQALDCHVEELLT